MLYILYFLYVCIFCTYIYIYIYMYIHVHVQVPYTRTRVGPLKTIQCHLSLRPYVTSSSVLVPPSVRRRQRQRQRQRRVHQMGAGIRCYRVIPARITCYNLKKRPTRVRVRVYIYIYIHKYIQIYKIYKNTKYELWKLQI